MRVVDDIILDPSDFVPGGAELDLSGEGFRVTDAPFAEADVEIEMQRAEFGETPTNWHPPNQSIPLTLELLDEGEVNRVQAFAKLQQKIGKFNQFGEHWMRRDFKYEGAGKVAGSLGKRVYKATCPDLSAWGRGQLPDAVLTLVTGPYWYANVEVQSEAFTEEAARELVFELSEVLGTSPGLIRIRITNKGEADLRGLILAGESRDHPQDETADTTAALSYAAADLTLKGGSEVKEVEGVKVVENDELTAGWLSILNSEHGEHGHLTHVGVRRPWIRAEALEGDPEDIQLKLRWRPLGAVNWSENRIVPLNIVGDYQLYDLGEARPERAALGDQRWEWDLQASVLSGAGKVRLHRVEVLPTEQYAVVRTPPLAAQLDSQVAQDDFEQAAGNLTGKSLALGGVWGSEGAETDFTVNTETQTARRTAKDGSSTSRFALAGTTLYTGVVVEAAVRSSKWFGGFNAVQAMGLFVRRQEGGPELRLSLEAMSDELGDHSFVPAGLPDLVADQWYYLKLMVTDDGVWFKWASTQPISSTAPPDEEGYSALYAPGGARETGYIGFFDRSETATPGTRDVDQFRAYSLISSADNRVCRAGRSIEFRSEGIFRQHPTEDVWGELIPVGSGGLHSMPSGLEERKSRYIIVPSQGDLSLIDHPGGELPDTGDNPLEAQTFDRPAYLASREAA